MSDYDIIRIKITNTDPFALIMARQAILKANLAFDQANSAFAAANAAYRQANSNAVIWTVKTSNYTAFGGELLDCDTSNGSFTITIPSNANVSTRIYLNDLKRTWNANNLIVVGSNIENSNTLICNVPIEITLICVSANNWKIGL